MSGKISVVIPTLGTRPDYLAEALASVMNQTMPPLEVLVVHNGNDQSTPGIPPQMRLIRIPVGSGVARARNAGAREAIGTYVAFLDDDDLWDRSYLELMTQRITVRDPDMLLGRLDAKTGDVVQPFMDATSILDRHHALVMNPGSTGSNTVVRRSTLMDLGGYDPALPPAEDMGLLADFLLAGKTICVVPDAQAILRHHGADRLTRADRVAISTLRFFHKYRKSMSWRQRCYFRWRLLDLRFRSTGARFYRLDYLLWSGLVVAIRMRPRDLWSGPDASHRFTSEWAASGGGAAGSKRVRSSRSSGVSREVPEQSD